MSINFLYTSVTVTPAHTDALLQTRSKTPSPLSAVPGALLRIASNRVESFSLPAYRCRPACFSQSLSLPTLVYHTVTAEKTSREDQITTEKFCFLKCKSIFIIFYFSTKNLFNGKTQFECHMITLNHIIYML